MKDEAERQGGRVPGIVIYTDGACLGNPGPGGAGVVMISGRFRKEIGRFLGQVTNNVAELTAIKIALEGIRRKDLPTSIHTDSSYAKGVLDGTYKIRKNVSLVKEIRDLLAAMEDVELVKVMGHAGIPENERADLLASKAAASGKNSIEEFESSVLLERNESR